MFRRFEMALLIAGLAALIAGCGGPNLAEVQGTILVDGVPVPGVLVEFQPAEGSPSFGETDASGHYELRFSRNKKGAEIGTHSVRISKEFDYDENAIRAPGVKRVIPPQFNDESQLTGEVIAGENKLDFTVTSLRIAVQRQVPRQSMSE